MQVFFICSVSLYSITVTEVWWQQAFLKEASTQIHILNLFHLQVLFDRVVNVEAAESLSKPHELFIYLPLSEHRLDAELSEISLEVSVPVHARYLRPSSDPNVYHSVVTILHPGLYYNCSSSGMH